MNTYSPSAAQSGIEGSRAKDMLSVLVIAVESRLMMAFKYW